ncbi:hypothetical protein [Janibacter sp. G56]|uniref:hypothetical protein n=1 Tax=Janibacter sp. G56 TaxID=3418717 RepID=UPI003D016B14
MTMIVECSTCPVRGLQCDDCMVTALMPEGVELPLDAAERMVVTRLVRAGLVRPDVAATATARREPWEVRRVVAG